MSSSHLNNPLPGATGTEDPDLTWIDNRVAQRLFGGALRWIGGYRVLGVLGSGGMGLVYLATDDRLQRQVALKLLSTRSHTPEGVDRLLREARAVARLSHPCVVQIYEAGVHDGQVYIVMECVPGQTLADWTREPSRSWRVVRDLFVAIAQGVCAAHAVGIVHRDLKPSNILVDRRGRPKVADFGLARTHVTEMDDPTQRTHADAEATSPLTHPGILAGTPRYMAPEQQDAQTTSIASDQYSFCLVMWEFLYQRHPFEAADEDTMLAAKLAGRFHPPPLRAKVPAHIRRALLRGLQPAPSARWPTMQALLQQLERDPWRRCFPWIVALAGLLVAPITLTVQRLSHVPAGQMCRAAAVQRTAEVWSPLIREALAQHFARAASSFGADAAWRALSRGIDAYAEQWGQAQQGLCNRSPTRAPDPII